MKKNIPWNTIIQIGVPILIGAGLFAGIHQYNKRRRAFKIGDFAGFNPMFFRTENTTLDPQRAKVLADEAYNSVGYLWDDPQKMVGVIKQAGSTANLSMISHYFAIRHSKSLGSYVAEYFDRKGESKEIIRALKNLR